MLQRHLQEQVDLLREHLESGAPDADFIERHAMAIIDLARSLPSPVRMPPAGMLKVYTRLHEAAA